MGKAGLPFHAIKLRKKPASTSQSALAYVRDYAVKVMQTESNVKLV